MEKIIFSLVCLFSLLILMVGQSFAAQFNLTPLLTVSEEYNDNIFLDPDNEEDDFITAISPGIMAELLWQTAGASLQYTPTYVFYDEFSEFDGWRHSLLGSVYKEITSRTRVELSNAYLRTEEPISSDPLTVSDDPLEPPSIEDDRLRRGREEYWTNASTARIDHRFGEEDVIFATYRYFLRKGVDDDTDDEYISTPSLGLTYWFTKFWGMDTEFSYANENRPEGDDLDEWYGRLRGIRRFTRHFSGYVQYDHTAANYDEREDFKLYEPSVGITYDLDEDTRIDVGFGYYIQDLENGDEETGAVVNAAVDKVWRFRRGLMGVTALSGNDIDSEGTEDLGFHIYYSLQGRAEYFFTQNFSGNLFGGYRWDDYPDEEPDERTDKTITAGAGLNYQALRWMTLSLNYAFSDLNSDAEEEEYTENRVIFAVTLSPSQPYRFNW